MVKSDSLLVRISRFHSWVTATAGLLIVIIFLLGAWFFYHELSEEIESRNNVLHAQHVLDKLGWLYETLPQCEAGVRGYVITGDPRIKRQYDLHSGEVTILLEKVESLVKDQQAKEQIKLLKPLLANKLNIMKTAIQVRSKAGLNVSLLSPIIHQGTYAMEDIAVILDRILERETELSELHSTQLNKEAERTKELLWVLTVLGFLFLCAVFLYIDRVIYAKDLQQKRLRAIFDSAAQAIITISDQGIIKSANNAAYKMFGYPLQKLNEITVTDILPNYPIFEQNRPLISQMMTGQYKSLEPALIETVGKRLDGSSLPLEIAASTIATDSGHIITCIINDLTERKEVERRMSEFYSMVSHELRTPLSSILGTLSLMEGGRTGELSERAIQLVKIARADAERLIALINDILDVRKIQAGKLKLHFDELDIRKLVQTALESMQIVADQANVQLWSQINASGKIICDPVRIDQVLTNLLSNAIKFSPPGSDVLLKVDKTVADMYRFSIIDKGPGIPAEYKHKLFGLFQQLDPSDSRAKGGTGLGLAISKGIVEQHHGTIGVSGTVGQGSTFWFEIPVDAGRKPLLGSTRQSIPALYVALRMDHDENYYQVMLKQMLDNKEFRMDQSSMDQSNPIHEARAYLNAHGNPDLVVLEISLPDGTGPELMNKLEADANNKSNPVIILLRLLPTKNNDRSKAAQYMEIN